MVYLYPGYKANALPYCFEASTLFYLLSQKCNEFIVTASLIILLLKEHFHVLTTKLHQQNMCSSLWWDRWWILCQLCYVFADRGKGRCLLKYMLQLTVLLWPHWKFLESFGKSHRRGIRWWDMVVNERIVGMSSSSWFGTFRIRAFITNMLKVNRRRKIFKKWTL